MKEIIKHKYIKRGLLSEREWKSEKKIENGLLSVLNSDGQNTRFC